MIPMPISSNKSVVAATMLALAAACASPKSETHQAGATRADGAVYVVKDTTLQSTLEVSATAAPIEQATLSTKLMGTVLEVTAREGDVITAGQPLLRIDARDLTAKADQIRASLAEAEAVHGEAVTHANRIRALFADSVATRAQLDAAETAVARSDAAVRSANAAASELAATTAYAVVRAPFGGIVTKRFVDPGAFAAPGAPLIVVQNVRQLRLSGSATPEIASGVQRGLRIDATIEGRPVVAIVEGVVPAAAGNLYTINALVDNRSETALSGSAATLNVPAAMHTGLVVPRAALIRQGDLVGVTVRTSNGDDTRWIRIGANAGDMVEVNSGLRAGDRVVVPSKSATTVAARN